MKTTQNEETLDFATERSDPNGNPAAGEAIAQAGPHEGRAAIVNAKLILNGEKVDSVTGRVFEVRNPATQEVIGYVPKANGEDVHNAIEVAKRGKSIMAALPAHRRAQILRKTADLIADQHEELSRLLCRENGKTIRQCRFEITTTQRLFVDFGEEAKRIGGHYLPMDAVPGLEHMVAYTIRQPIGVVVGIVPFNYPAELFAHKIPGALAAGNSVIVKPPSKCPLTVLRIGELILEAGLPPEGMQMLTGSPRDMGDELFTDPAIGMISLTGSVASAREIARKAAGTLKRTAFELGGTDPMIVLEDANLDLAAEAVVQGRLTNGAGQICCAVKRVLVQASVYDEFLALLVERVGGLRWATRYRRTPTWVRLSRRQMQKRSMPRSRRPSKWAPSASLEARESVLRSTSQQFW